MPLPKTMPELIKVDDSSNVAALTYDYKSMFLYVQFMPKKLEKTQILYRYAKVPEGTFDRFRKAPSKGLFLWTHIRGKFGYAKWTGSGWRKETALKKHSAAAKRQKQMEAKSK